MAPRWEVVDAASFASVRVALPAGAHVHCESDAVVTMSHGVDVKANVSGGVLQGLARSFLTSESFFTTQVTAPAGKPGDVLLAASDPGGIVLHRLQRGEDLLLTSGAYMAGDASVEVTSEVQSNIGNSLLSGTGFFLMRARGAGVLALAAHGSVHKYTLAAGERRSVDNGHLLAWSASMPYETGMATRSMYHSVATGEGLMCHFMGPGTLYLQSHKPDEGGGGDGGSSTNRRRPARPATGAERAFGLCFVCVFLSIFVSVFGFAAYQFIMEGGEYTVNGQPRHFEGYAPKKSGARARVRDSLGDGYSGGGSKGNRRRQREYRYDEPPEAQHWEF